MCSSKAANKRFVNHFGVIKFFSSVACAFFFNLRVDGGFLVGIIFV